MTTPTPTAELTTASGDAQAELVKAIWHCIVQASSMNVVTSGAEVNAAIRQLRAAIENEAAAAARTALLDELEAEIANLRALHLHDGTYVDRDDLLDQISRRRP